MKTARMIRDGLLLGAVAVWAGSTREAARASERTWRQNAEDTALVQGAQVLWQYNHGAADTKPCFHPLALPGGPVLTGFRPADHPWHRALWFSWKFINGVNYWEEDPQTGQSAGRTEYHDTRVQTRADHSALIRTKLSYRPAEGEPVLEEERTIEISAPDGEGIYRMDWTCRFKALTKAVLDRTPLPDEPDGRLYGGYAGLSVRFAPGVNAVRAVTTAAGPVSFQAERYRGKAEGMDYSGDFGGYTAGIAILDHPRNLNSPTPWYAINGAEMHYFSPAVLCYGPHTLEAGDALTLRYRVVVHPGQWDAERLRIEQGRFAGSADAK